MGAKKGAKGPDTAI